MTNQKQPAAGEWWRHAKTGITAFIVGKDHAGTTWATFANDAKNPMPVMDLWDGWQHLPDCTGFDWQPTEPETFPQWLTSTSKSNNVAYIRRDSEQTTVTVYRDGVEHFWISKWDAAQNTDRTRLTEAEALERLDWVDITETHPEHVLRIGIDWFLDESKQWVMVSPIHNDWTVSRRWKHCGLRTRCLRKDLPPIPDPPSDPLDASHGLQQATKRRRVRLWCHDETGEMRKSEHRPGTYWIEIHPDAGGCFVESAE